MLVIYASKKQFLQVSPAEGGSISVRKRRFAKSGALVTSFKRAMKLFYHAVLPFTAFPVIKARFRMLPTKCGGEYIMLGVSYDGARKLKRSQKIETQQNKSNNSNLL